MTLTKLKALIWVFIMLLSPVIVIIVISSHSLNTNVLMDNVFDDYVHSSEDFWTATVKLSYVTVRRKPYSSSIAIGYTYLGETHSVLSTSGRWVEVDLKGSRGWIESSSVSLSGSQTLASEYITLTLNNYIGNFANELAISYGIVSVSSKYSYELSHTVYLLDGEWYVEYVAVDKYGNMASARQRSYFDQEPTLYEKI